MAAEHDAVPAAIDRFRRNAAIFMEIPDKMRNAFFALAVSLMIQANFDILLLLPPGRNALGIQSHR